MDSAVLAYIAPICLPPIIGRWPQRRTVRKQSECSPVRRLTLDDLRQRTNGWRPETAFRLELASKHRQMYRKPKSKKGR